jgi:hypothetical protein
MAHQVFISYASEDKSVADSVCKALEGAGIRCWYAPRDVPYAVDYEEAIVDAISASKLMLLILSVQSNDSKHVKREVQNACREEPQIPVLPFLVESIELNKSLKYYIGSVQWLSALTPPLEDHLQKLVRSVQARLTGSAVTEGARTGESQERIEEPKIVELSPEQRIRSAGEKLAQEPAYGGGDQTRYEGGSTPNDPSGDTAAASESLLGAQRVPHEFAGAESRSHSVQQLPVSPKATEIPEKGFSVDGKTVGVLVICFIVLVALVLDEFRLVYGSWWVIVLRVCMIVLILADFVYILSLPSTAKRSRISTVITGGILLAVLGLTWSGALFFHWFTLREVYFACIALFAVAQGFFLARTSMTTTTKRRTALVMSAPILLMFFVLVERATLRSPLLYDDSFYVPSTPSPSPSEQPSPPLTALENLTRGNDLFSKQRFAESEPFYRAAVRLEPGNATYNNNLGTALFGQGNYSEAEVFFQEAVRLNPKDPVMRNNLGNALFFQQRYASAEAQYVQATLLDPKNGLYQENLTKARAAISKSN